MNSPKDLARNLYKIACRQDRYFTHQQAKQLGYSQQSQSYHVRNGNWERKWRGIYRLNNYPCSDYPDLIILYLWTCNRQGIPQGVISHDMALYLYGLGSWTQQKNTITVPPGFRRIANPPGGWNSIVLHHAILSPVDIQILHRVPFTTPLKTIIDLLVAKNMPTHHLREAMTKALDQHLITHKQMAESKLSMHERSLLVNQLSEINYEGAIEEIRHPRKLQLCT